jgi:hypothetical protein
MVKKQKTPEAKLLNDEGQDAPKEEASPSENLSRKPAVAVNEAVRDALTSREEEVPSKKESLPKREAIEVNGEPLVTAVAIKTTVKHIGRYYTLEKGKSITAPASVIHALKVAKVVR